MWRVSPAKAGRTKRRLTPVHSAPGPGNSIPIAADTKDAERIPCAIGRPNGVWRAKSGSVWIGL